MKAFCFLVMVLSQLMTVDDTLAEKFWVVNNATSGEGSLYQAIQDANAQSGLDSILFDPAVRGIIETGLGLPEITESLVIFGPGKDLLSIYPNNGGKGLETSHFYEDSLFVYGLTFKGSTSRFANLFMEGGKNYYFGCRFYGHERTYQNMGGGGLYLSGGSHYFYSCEVSNNKCYVGGAGMTIRSGTQVFIHNSVINDNTVVSASERWGGGGIYNAGNLYIENSTISGNVHPHRGGGINNLLYGRTVYLNHVTVTGNSAAVGGGIYNRDKDENGTDTVWLRNTIVAGNTSYAESNDLWGQYISHGYNLIQDTAGAIFTGETETDVYATDPQIKALDYYSYEALHHPLLPQSPCIDNASQSSFLPIDQLGRTRPVDGNNDGIPLADIGAVEYILDSDKDGVSDWEEQGKEGNTNDYDGNNDGEADKNQNHVVSLKSYDGSHYITIVAPENTFLSRVRMTKPPYRQVMKSEPAYPLGFLSFKMDSLHLAASPEVKIYLPAGKRADQYENFGPTPDQSYPHRYMFAFNGETGAEFDEHIITLHFKDGMTGDHDLTANNSLLAYGAPPNIQTAEDPSGLIYHDSGLLYAYPNPVNAKVKFKLPVDHATKVCIYIFDMHGKTLKKQIFQGIQDKSPEINCADLPEGFYLYQVILNRQVYSGILVK